MYLLDSEHISVLQRESDPEFSTLRSRMNEHSPHVFFLPIITFHEQLLGWHTYIKRKQKPGDIIFGYRMFEKMLQSFASYAVLPFDESAMNEFQRIEKQIGVGDKRIAAIALAHDLTLLTRDGHFDNIPSLRVEDWTRPIV